MGSICLGNADDAIGVSVAVYFIDVELFKNYMDDVAEFTIM